MFEPVWLRAIVGEGDAGFLITQLRGRHVSTIVADEDVPRLLTFTRLRIRDELAPRNYQFTARRRDTSHLRLEASVTSTDCAAAE